MTKLIKWLGNELRQNATLAAIIGAVFGALIGYVLNSSSSTLWQIIFWVMFGVIIGGSLGVASVYSFYRYFKERGPSSKSQIDDHPSNDETANWDPNSLKTKSRWIRNDHSSSRSRWKKP